ncbi:MAG: helix-turn-helix transcriptional regulator [Rikenellaceae bacterium]
MKDKITYLMKSEGLTTTRLAEILEIQPSAVSHLVSGRNKPGYDLLRKILRRFPRLNPDWLLLDSAVPYREDVVVDGGVGAVDVAADVAEAADGAVGVDGVQTLPFGGLGGCGRGSGGSKSPIFVVVFYDDGSCENFSMRQ